MPINTLILGFMVIALGGIGLLTIYSELRRRRFEPHPSHDHIFRCKNCSSVYTDDPDVDRSRCPQCGKLNEPIAF